MRSVAAHPGLDLGHFADPSVFDLCLRRLESRNSHTAIRSGRRDRNFSRQPGIGRPQESTMSWSSPSKDLCRRRGYRESAEHECAVGWPRLRRQHLSCRASGDDRRRSECRALYSSPRRGGGCRHRPWPRLPRRGRRELVPADRSAIADADHADADAVIRAQRPRSWIRQHGGRSQRGLLQKVRLFCSIIVLLSRYDASACCRSFFIPAQLWRDDASGVPAPRQCVSGSRRNGSRHASRP